jgi:hypothetical protein
MPPPLDQGVVCLIGRHDLPCPKPSFDVFPNRNQVCKLKEKVCSCFHSWHNPYFGHHLFSTLSPVRTLVCKISYENNLYFGGAQFAHMHGSLENMVDIV